MSTIRVLIIDDDRLILEMLKLALNKPGIEVLAASDGDMGLRMIREQQPDIAIIDIAMPGMDGYDVISRIRSADDSVRSLPIIILTAHEQAIMRNYAHELGADLYLVKPVATARLIEHIHALVGQRGAATATAG